MNRHGVPSGQPPVPKAQFKAGLQDWTWPRPTPLGQVVSWLGNAVKSPLPSPQTPCHPLASGTCELRYAARAPWEASSALAPASWTRAEAGSEEAATSSPFSGLPSCSVSKPDCTHEPHGSGPAGRAQMTMNAGLPLDTGTPTHSKRTLKPGRPVPRWVLLMLTTGPRGTWKEQ